MLAIDPGQQGGMAVAEPYHIKDFLHGDTSSVNAIKMPITDRDIFSFLESSLHAPNGIDAYIEVLVKYTGRNMPSSAMAVYASNWGFIKGVLTALHFRIVLVRPQQWQKALGLGNSKGMTRTEWKNKLKQKAEQLYPNIKVTLATADALLILEAARRGLIG